MGVYVRPDSRYYWLLLQQPSGGRIRESTKVRTDAPTPSQRKGNRALAVLDLEWPSHVGFVTEFAVPMHNPALH